VRDVNAGSIAPGRFVVYILLGIKIVIERAGAGTKNKVPE